MDLRAGLALWLLCGLLLQPGRAERPPGPHLDETPIAGETNGTPRRDPPGPLTGAATAAARSSRDRGCPGVSPRVRCPPRFLSPGGSGQVPPAPQREPAPV